MPFVARQGAAYRAFYEYMPFMPASGNPRKGNDLYRRLPLGRNAELFLLDERQYRDDQPCDDAFFEPCPEAESEPRRFLGRTQLEWLKNGLRDSGATWKLVGNQLMIMAFELSQGAQVTKDSWDGYGPERRELMTHIASRGIRDVSFLTGDIHTFFAGDVGIDGRGPESDATEFVGGSITSLGVPETVAATTGAPLPPEQTVLLTNNLRPPTRTSSTPSRPSAATRSSRRRPVSCGWSSRAWTRRSRARRPARSGASGWRPARHASRCSSRSLSRGGARRTPRSRPRARSPPRSPARRAPGGAAGARGSAGT